MNVIYRYHRPNRVVHGVLVSAIGARWAVVMDDGETIVRCATSFKLQSQ